MSEPEHKESELPPERPPVVYASPTKRAWAWVGVLYMLIILLLVTYYLAKGVFLSGIGTLMVVPALWGLAVTAITQHKAAPRRVPFMMSLLTCSVCLALSFWCIFSGVPALLRAMGG